VRTCSARTSMSAFTKGTLYRVPGA
jgi:hypothetical protein